MVKEGLTVFVEGKTLGKIEAAVSKPSYQNKLENKKPSTIGYMISQF
jgi:hypothetical protein